MFEHSFRHILRYYRSRDDTCCFAYLMRNTIDVPLTCHVFLLFGSTNVCLFIYILFQLLSFSDWSYLFANQPSQWCVTRRSWSIWRRWWHNYTSRTYRQLWSVIYRSSWAVRTRTASRSHRASDSSIWSISFSGEHRRWLSSIYLLLFNNNYLASLCRSISNNRLTATLDENVFVESVSDTEISDNNNRHYRRQSSRCRAMLMTIESNELRLISLSNKRTLFVQRLTDICQIITVIIIYFYVSFSHDCLTGRCTTRSYRICVWNGEFSSFRLLCCTM